MAINEEIVSFDLNTDKAVSQVDSYVRKLKSLQSELDKATKEGKDLGQINTQIAVTTAKLNQALQQHTATLKGTTAQTKAAIQANNALARSQEQATKAGKGFDIANRKTVQSISSVAHNAKSAAGAIAGAGALLGGFAPIAAVATIAVEKLVEVISDLVTETDLVADATRSLIPEITKEKSELDALFAVAVSDLSTKQERVAAIDTINERYGEYLPNLLKETDSVDALAQAQSTLNKVIIEQAVARFKAAKIQELQQKLVENTFAKAEKERKAAQRSRLENFIREADALANKVGIVSFVSIVRLSEAVEDFELNRGIEKATDQLANIDQTAQAAEEQLKQLFEGLNFAGGASVDVAKEISSRIKKQAEQTANDEKKRRTATTKATKEQAKVLQGSLADLEAQLQAVNKQINEQTLIGDTKAIEPLARQYRSLKQQIEEARKELDLLLNPKKPEKLEFEASFVFDAEGTNDAIREALTEAERQAGIDRLTIQNEQIETLAAIQARKIEQQANREIEAAQGNTEALKAIEERRAKQRQELDNETTRLLLENRLKVIELERQAIGQTEQDLARLDTEVAKINLQLEELSRKEVKIETDQAEKDLDALGSKIASIGLQIGELGQQVLGFFVEQAGRVSAQYDNAVEKQRSAFEELLSNQETASVQAIQIEAERLEALEAERERAKNREAILIKAQIAANAALAIARAAAEGGGIASAITIASTVASLIFGFAAARQQAEQAFFEGTTYVRRGKGEKPGRDTVKARLNEGEAVIPTATNSAYKSTVEAIYSHKIPAEVLNRFVNLYPVYGSKMAYSLASDVEAKGILLNQAFVPKTGLIVLPQGPSQPTVYNITKMDKNGFTTYVKKSIAKQESLSNRHK